MRRCIVVVLIAACGKSEAPPGPSPHHDEGSPAAMAPDAKAAGLEMPVKGVANSAIESVPRKDWPCRYVQTLDSVDPQGTHIATRWEYGNRAHCWIPADVAGSRGLVGCPDKQVQQNLENKVEMAETYSYDRDDHLTAVQTIGARFEYEWDGNLVRGVRLRDEVHPFATTANGVEVKQGDDIIRIEVDAQGHVTKYQRIDSLGLEPTVFTWKGTRLAKLQEIGTTKIEYNCKLAPK